jgi:hypothetical protein
MDKKTSGIVAVLGSILLCGLPGFCVLCMSMVVAIGPLLPDSDVPPEEVGLVITSAVSMIGLSLICLVIPIGVGFWSWRSYQKEEFGIRKVLIPEDDF